MSIFRALVRGLRWIHIISQISIVERSSNFRFFVTFPVCTPRAGFAQQKGNRKSSPLKTNLNLANLIALNLKTHCVQTAKIFNTSFALSIAKKYSCGAISVYWWFYKWEWLKTKVDWPLGFLDKEIWVARCVWIFLYIIKY